MQTFGTRVVVVRGGTVSDQQGQWSIDGPSTITLKTSRVGLMSFHAHAPVVDGTVRIGEGDVEVQFDVAIDQVATGNPLLDPEVHALVRAQSDGRLRFQGRGSDFGALTGTASAGTISIPLELTADQPQTSGDGADLQINGQTSFSNIHVPLPGLGHIKHIEIDISGVLTLLRRTAEAG